MPELGKWYLHLFDVTQADLNWENPEVRAKMADILRFWKTTGIKGFRFDVVNLISKPEVYEDDHDGDGHRYGAADGKELLVLCSLTEGEAPIPLPEGWETARKLLGNYPDLAASLRPYECVALIR